MKNKDNHNNYEIRKIQGLVGESSYSMIIPKNMANDLGIGKGDYVKISLDEENHKIVLEKA